MALLRHLCDGTDSDAELRLAEVRRLLDDDIYSTSETTSEADPKTGYRSWSTSYDEPGNPIIALEQPAVWALVESVPPGRALDAACGTGRHARHLVDCGHDVVGVDLTPQMLDLARDRVRGARFVEADLTDIPADDDQFDLVVVARVLVNRDLHDVIRARSSVGEGHERRAQKERSIGYLGGCDGGHRQHDRRREPDDH